MLFRLGWNFYLSDERHYTDFFSAEFDMEICVTGVRYSNRGDKISYVNFGKDFLAV